MFSRQKQNNRVIVNVVSPIAAFLLCCLWVLGHISL